MVEENSKRGKLIKLLFVVIAIIIVVVIAVSTVPGGFFKGMVGSERISDIGEKIKAPVIDYQGYITDYTNLINELRVESTQGLDRALSGQEVGVIRIGSNESKKLPIYVTNPELFRGIEFKGSVYIGKIGVLEKVQNLTVNGDKIIIDLPEGYNYVIFTGIENIRDISVNEVEIAGEKILLNPAQSDPSSYLTPQGDFEDTNLEAESSVKGTEVSSKEGLRYEESMEQELIPGMDTMR